MKRPWDSHIVFQDRVELHLSFLDSNEEGDDDITTLDIWKLCQHSMLNPGLGRFKAVGMPGQRS